MFQDKSILEIIQDPEGMFQFITDCFRTGHLSVLGRLLVNGSFICVLYSVLFLKKSNNDNTVACELWNWGEPFWIECLKAKDKVMNPANHKRHRQSSEPIKTRSNDM